MKQFKDLQFTAHRIGDGKQAVMMFENGYGVSVVRLKVAGIYRSYTRNENEWELAVLEGNEEKWSRTYDTPITDDVIGHLSEREVSEVMRKVQELPIKTRKTKNEQA